MAFALTLGVGCKKEENLVSSNDSKIEKVEKATIIKSDVLGVEAPGGGYPSGADTYPHNTGGCVCGKYAGCHPYEYWTVAVTDGLYYYVPHLTKYGQTTFPPGAVFPGNSAY